MKTAAKTKVTLLLDSAVYEGLRNKVGQRGVGSYLSELARPFVDHKSLEAGYKAMAEDAEHEREAREWIEADLSDGIDTKEEAWRF